MSGAGMARPASRSMTGARKLRTGQLVVPESVAALPMFAELVVEGAAAEAPPVRAPSEVAGA